MFSSTKQPRVAVVGGGVAGSSIALYLGELGAKVSLFEKSSSLVSGPPICHLHAGGNLYREIPDSECVTLLHESFAFMQRFEDAIDYRPTIITIPLEDSGEPKDLLARLELLKQEYLKLGGEGEYFQFLSKEQLLEQAKRNKWLRNFVKYVKLDLLKFPVVLVQEYGINVFVLGATLSLALKEHPNVTLQMAQEVCSIKKLSKGFEVEGEVYDYLINAAGFLSGKVDDMLGYKRKRFVEFKAAYVSRCDSLEGVWPEMIFHGKRGTPQGMAQFTPYPDGYFQLHGMSQDITLFRDGLVQNSNTSSQPNLPQHFLEKITRGWDKEDVEQRTQRAIAKVSRFIPAFKDAKVVSKPLYGAQQIPGDDADLRAAEVSFESGGYARCEIVKASSVMKMGIEIAKDLQKLGFLDGCELERVKLPSLEHLDKEHLRHYAQQVALQRGYPSSLGSVCFDAL